MNFGSFSIFPIWKYRENSPYFSRSGNIGKILRIFPDLENLYILRIYTTDLFPKGFGEVKGGPKVAPLSPSTSLPKHNARARAAVRSALAYKSEVLYMTTYEEILMSCLEVFDPDYLFRQLAEECGELVQASLKYIRALNGETPITEEDAFDHYLEELVDVALMLKIAKADLSDDAKKLFEEKFKFKRARFIDRLNEEFEQRRDRRKQG